MPSVRDEAPSAVQGTRVTRPADCRGTDCIPLSVDERNINNHRGRDTILIWLGLRRIGPTLFSYDKRTGAVANLGPVFAAGSPFARLSGDGWYWSATRPTTLYVERGGPELLRYDVAAKTLERVFDVTAQFGRDRGIRQPRSSDDDTVHSATLVDLPSGKTLGCVLYREPDERFSFWAANGEFAGCRVDPGGRSLTIRDDADGVPGVEQRVVDLDTEVERVVADAGGTERPLAGALDVTGQYYVYVARHRVRRDAFITRLAEPAPAAGLPAGVATDLATAPRAGAAAGAPQAIAAVDAPELTADATALPAPQLLPVATTAQVPLTTAYNALNVPAKPAGATYADPTTGVTITKLTSATFPAAAANFGHDYAEGGNEVSLPYNGETRAVLVYNGGTHWLIDFTPGVGVGNARALSGTLSPFMDLAFTFSNNPATPYYAYVSNGSAVRRMDIRTMTEAPGNGWPQTETSAMWLHQSENDAMFVWMRGATGSTMVAFEPATNTKKTYTNANMNEPRIDRGGRYVGLSMNSPGNGLAVWDWNTGTIAWSTSGDPGIPFAHNASLKRRWVVSDWNTALPNQFAMFTSNVANSGVRLPGPSISNTLHGNGSWIQSPADLNDQWAIFNHYGSLRPPGSSWLAPGGMVLMTPNGQRRLLGHSYNTTTTYTFYAFAKFSPDGRFVLFSSNMNGASRSDLFIAALPTTSPSDTVAPTVSLTAPTGGSTVSGSVAVSANASDNVGVAGVQFRLDGANLGSEDTTAPYGITWDTTQATNGSHALTAVARDAAGNSTISAPVSVTVANGDTTAPTISGVAASNVSSGGATITWTTNEAADSAIEYGTTTAYGTVTAVDPSRVTAHSQAVSGLLPATLYHYRVRSRDAAGNLAMSGDFTFTTVAGGTGPILELKLNDGSGVVAADSSGYGNTGALVNGATWIQVPAGVSLDGVDDYVRVPHAGMLNAFPLTVSVWLKTSSSTGQRGVVNKYVANSYNGYQIFFENGDLCAWYLRSTTDYVYDGTSCSLRTSGYADGRWHQVALVVDGAGGRLYVDGVQVASQPWTGAAGATTTTQELQLGHYPSAGGTAFLPGEFDDLVVYNRALNTKRIAGRYRRQVGSYR
jgi:hypothetical protein